VPTCSRRRFLQGSLGLTGLGLVVGCGCETLRMPVAARRYRLGVLSIGTPPAEFALMLQGLREGGYDERTNLEIAYRFGNDDAAIAAHVEDLVSWGSDVLLAVDSRVVRAAMRSSATLPIVMIATGDPVRGGLIERLARPGGHVTGVTTTDSELSGKRLEILRDLVPGLVRVGVMYDVTTSDTEITNETFDFGRLPDAAARLGLDVLAVPVFNINQMDGHLAQARTQGCGAILVQQQLSPSAENNLVQGAARQRIGVLYPGRDGVAAGLLVSFGPRLSAVYARAATYVDRILKGTKPADLPVQQPTTFDLAFNQTTAQALGLTIPNALLQQATDVMQ
jgi:putative ABC transport system substrate-binding protein